jgi:LPXTG-motif cell wall-anchored protein
MQQRARILLGLAALFLGGALLATGAFLFSFHPPVEYAPASENETGPDTAPMILIAAGAGVLITGGGLLLRRHGNKRSAGDAIQAPEVPPKT